MCLFEQCNADVTRGPIPQSTRVDLSDPEAPFIGWPLARVCQETKWTPGLVFVCDNNSGGIGNIRNYILTCVRYAIEAGATGLIMPQIRTRSVDNLSDLMKEYKPFDYFFDDAHFRDGLTTSCPQITIYNQTWEVPHIGKNLRPRQITPRDFGDRSGCDKRDLYRHTDSFGYRFRIWLADTGREAGLPPVGPQHPRLVRLNWGVQWDFPVHRDGPEFWTTYGGLLRFRDDILELGRAVTSAMRTLRPSSAPLHGREGKDGFVGFHLRSENDALKGWPLFDDQLESYLRAASHHGFRKGFLATGNETEAAKFVEKAEMQHRMRVVTKHELLKSRPADMSALKALSWDQQALIDYIVLVRSDYFLGVNPSSFSMTVAVKRHLQVEGLHTRPWKIGGDDGRSWIIGKFEKYWEDWLFMYDSLWP